MQSIQNHLRKTLLAGIFAAVPVAVTLFICWYIDNKTRVISEKVFGKPIPIVGILIAIAAIYLCGLVATSLLGKWFLKLIDRALARVPGLRTLYSAWKQIALTPGGSEGVFARVVLVPDETGSGHTLGFCSGKPLDAQSDTFCVFIPAAPNPMNGKLFFVRREKCVFVDTAPEEAFKAILSTGNYVPPQVGNAARQLTENAVNVVQSAR